MSRNQNFKSYGRGKHSNHPNTVVHSSIQFDKFLCENSNKPTASKSAGTIGKWGITSFTSIRSSSFTVGHSKDGSRFSSLNKKRATAVTDSGIQNKRLLLNNNIKNSPILPARKFFKSRNSLDDPTLKVYKSLDPSDTTSTKKNKHHRLADENKKQKGINVFDESKPKNVPMVRSHDKSTKNNLKKNSSPKISENNAHISEDFNKLRNLPSPPKERDKPPIVLRIFRGTSQLITDPATKNDLQLEENVTSPLSSPVKFRLEDNENIENSCDIENEKILETKQNNMDTEPPDPVIFPKILRRRSPIKSKSPSPEKITSTKSSSRRNFDKSKSVSPEIAIPVKNLRRKTPEKLKSASPERITKNLKRRSPEKSRSPSSEPTITTRSLRRRPARAPTPEITQNPPSPKRISPKRVSPKHVSPKHVSPKRVSPKRVLRSAKNIASTGKIVITNIHSDHPSVYTLTENTTASSSHSHLSPARKDSKECRSYSNKNKNKQTNKNIVPLKINNEDNPKDIDMNVPEINKTNATNNAKNNEVFEPCLDSDRAELLQLLEDNEDEDNSSQSNTALNMEEEHAEIPTKSVEKDILNDVASNCESALKIKIKFCDIKKDNGETIEETTQELIENSAESDTDKKSEITECAPISDSNITEKDLSTEPNEINLSCINEEDEKSGSASNENDDFEVKSTSNKNTSRFNKKGSIFKHRASNDGNKKRLALYKHKWTDEKDVNCGEDEKTNATVPHNAETLDSVFDMDVDDMPLTKFVRQSSSEGKTEFDDDKPVIGVKCPKQNKKFYTVVRNVKNAHQIQESGEYQEFNDDVEYILDALQDNNPIGTRCLSAITLATKCMDSAFRMHVRAHGTVTKFFKALHDATKDQSLGLCTATVMFVLSQETLNMDLDRDSLGLMLNLLESDASHTKALEHCGLTDSQLTKTRDKVKQICADIKSKGHAKHLNLDNITVGHLSMETLLSLTSQRAGEWFKEELRELGGLEHIIRTIVECCKHVDDTANAWSTTSLDKIRKVDRCLRVLENVTMYNEQNNQYLLDYQDGILIDTLVRMFKVFDYEIPLYPTYSITDKESTGAVLRECLIANLKVLINITHDYQNKPFGSVIIGSRSGVIESSLHVLLQVPQYIPKEEKFDLMLLTLILLINLVEHCEANRKSIIEAKAPSDAESIFETKTRELAVKALINMFYTYEELARNEEKKTDAILEGENTEKPPTNASQKVQEEFIAETISMLVQKAGQNMEHTLIAAYVAMLIGHLISDNEEYENFVRNHLPEKSFQFMISVLQKFHSFMNLTASGATVSSKGMKSIQSVIQKFIKSDENHGCTGQTTMTEENVTDNSIVPENNNSNEVINQSVAANKFYECSNNTLNVAISAS